MAASFESWTGGDAYEQYVGRWSRGVAREFLAWLGLRRGLRWLDVGCGTGALSRTILDLAAPARVRGVDRSADYVAHARGAGIDDRAGFDVGDAQSLPYAAGSFDAVVSGLALNFIPDSAAALAEMARVAAPGGTVAVYVWDYADGARMMRLFWDAAVALDPAAAALDEGRRFPLCRPGALAERFTRAGLARVETRAIEVPTEFRTFDDFWTPFLGGQGPAPGYVASLDEPARDALRDELHRRLPHDRDGSIRLTARAWAARGERR